MVSVTIGGKSLAGFDRPIELLKDCHRRIEHFLEVLQVVIERFGDGDLPDEGRRALETSLDYFAHAAPRHTADEEQSLFPLLRRSDDIEAREVMAELQRLESDHRRVEAWHGKVDAIGRRWLEVGRIDEASRTALRALLNELAATYIAHIRLEEERIFMLAAQILKDCDLTRVGSEMKQRRINA